TSGIWSDETSMALCLADSLLACGGSNPRDQMERYRRWQAEGYLSATGTCAGITPNVLRAIGAARWRRQVFAGSHDPRRLDPEPLARVAPCAMFFYADRDAALRYAVDAARLTCQAPLVLSATRVVAALVHAGLGGEDPLRGLDARLIEGQGPDKHTTSARLGDLLAGSFRNLPRAALRPAGHAIDVLEAALWVLAHTDNFRDAALLAANLGGLSDVIGAIVGQVLGAYRGADAIPSDWRAQLVQAELLQEFAARLHAAAFAAR
ncbi:MAG: ADP-ribosylglycohydrolase family protein, partial [Steroidobacteraceae bacterium]|nr:ADP-ribosylglycohydrolase family protein [Steroidobacteraceae bacterium]MDW8260496.1 ADP-ribosylglycohydrolase family protein [Gammaproteobacteria bacterium]